MQTSSGPGLALTHILCNTLCFGQASSSTEQKILGSVIFNTVLVYMTETSTSPSYPDSTLFSLVEKKRVESGNTSHVGNVTINEHGKNKPQRNECPRTARKAILPSYYSCHDPTCCAMYKPYTIALTLPSLSW